MASHDSIVDLELIAAFIDGRLAGEDRARAVKLLADSDEALELFAHAVQHQVPAEEMTVVPVAPAHREVQTPRQWRRHWEHWGHWKVIGPVAAAAAAVLAILPTLVSRGPQAVLATEYALELARDPHFTTGLTEGWEQRGWAVTRGVGSGRETGSPRQAGSALESKLAFRLGVRMVDLQVALQRGDTALAARLTSEVIESLNAVAMAEPVAASYATLRSRLATEPRGEAIAQASDAERQLGELLGSSAFAFGQWVGAAELAARMRDAAFFESPHGVAYIQSTEGLVSDDSAALRAIEARLKQGSPEGALEDVRAILQGVIRRRSN
jgi:hypothetical protein